ncbi:hypothetical protein FHG87_001996 [Trinorchestia longiramus]|nr:hypothetical protein FHG87_001996 [Trinorchestia longiramus]
MGTVAAGLTLTLKEWRCAASVQNYQLSLTNERSRSGSSAQPTVLYSYNEATTLGITHSLSNTSKVNISTNSSHHLNNSTHS